MTLNLDTVYLGDCLDVMQEIPDGSIDMICCDLPYETNHCKWDTIIPFEPLWEQYNRVIKRNGAIVLTGQGLFSHKLVMSNEYTYRYSMVWKKTNPKGFLNANKMPLFIHEDIHIFYKRLPTFHPQYTIGKKYTARRPAGRGGDNYGYLGANNIIDKTTRNPTTVVEISNSNYKSLHPTQKPLALLEYLIETYTNESDTVLDNCMGSGSTCVAAINTNRHYIGIEKEQRYFDIAQERIRQTKKQHMSKS